MEQEIYDDIALEQIAKNKFGLEVDIDHVVLRNAPVNHVAKATLFLTKKKQLLLYIGGTSKLSLGEVQKIVSRLGLKAELYMPPKGQPNYLCRRRDSQIISTRLANKNFARYFLVDTTLHLMIFAIIER